MFRVLCALLMAGFFLLGTHAAGAAEPDARQGRDAADHRNDAFEFAQQAMTGSAARALAQLGARFSVGSDELAVLVRRRQDLIAAWREADKRHAQAFASQTGYVNVADLAATVDRLKRELDLAEAELAARFPDFASLASPKPVSIPATQALLDADEAMVLLLAGNRESFAFAITRDAARVVRVDAKRTELTNTIRQLRRSLNPAAPVVMRSSGLGDAVVESGAEQGGVPLAFDRRLAHQLFVRFVAPLDDLIVPKRRVFFVLDPPFDSLPLSLLVTGAPQGDDADPAALRETAWLLKRQAIAVLPSVASLAVLRNSRVVVAAAPEPFRGYGAPLLGRETGRQQIASRSAGTSSSVYRGGRVDVEAVRALSPLPKTEGELRQLAEALGAGPDSIRTGAAATVAAVKADDLSRYRVIAFATHGLLAGEISGLAEPALVFTPPKPGSDADNGLLTSSDAAKLRLAADWVVLSACNTAAGDGTPGADGLSGLARAFFYAGARSLLVSHWPVRDDAAARLTTELFRRQRLDPKLGKADALRAATLALMADKSDPTLAHPAIWAPFVVVGEGR